MRLLRLPLIFGALVALLIVLAVIARVTGVWPLPEATHGRPHQTVP